jgi:hypothetical protein
MTVRSMYQSDTPEIYRCFDLARIILNLGRSTAKTQARRKHFPIPVLYRLGNVPARIYTSSQACAGTRCALVLSQ